LAIIGINLEDIERCPQCTAARPTLEYKGHFFDSGLKSDVIPVWFCYRCTSCGDLVGAKAAFPRLNVQDGNFVSIYIRNNKVAAFEIIPSPDEVDEDLPDKPRRYLEQAINSLHAPDGAIMLAGSAVDAMLKLKNYTEGSVYVRIQQAVSDHVLTEGMSQWAHAVRLEANKPRHADIDEPHATRELAEQTINFAQALGDFLFVLPTRIEEGTKASREAAGDQDS